MSRGKALLVLFGILDAANLRREDVAAAVMRLFTNQRGSHLVDAPESNQKPLDPNSIAWTSVFARYTVQLV